MKLPIPAGKMHLARPAQICVVCAEKSNELPPMGPMVQGEMEKKQPTPPTGRVPPAMATTELIRVPGGHDRVPVVPD